MNQLQEITQYYFFDGNSKVGPLSFEELSNKPIFKDTPVWRAGLADWINAGDLPELIDIIKTSPPPVPVEESVIEEENNKPRYDYSEVEDKAGVNYKTAMILTGILLVLNIILLDVALSSVGMLGVTGLAIASWWYFKQYFDSQKDTITGNFIMVIMGAHALFGFAYFYISIVPWGDLMDCSIFDLILLLFGFTIGCVNEFASHIGFIMFLVMVAAVANFIAGFRILMVNRRYPFPLKRIAVSCMFLLPFLFCNYFSEGILGSDSGIFLRTILSLPYILLFHHFYRADVDDKTP
ncbi:MAG: DUF4339 domain-containing protein [Chitinophagales bacterium]